LRNPGKTLGELANSCDGDHVTRAAFAVSILTLSTLHLKLFLKSIAWASTTDAGHSAFWIGLGSKVSDRAWQRSVPPRGSGWVDDQHALLL